MRRLATTLSAALLIAALLLVVGCGGDDDDGADTGQAETSGQLNTQTDIFEGENGDQGEETTTEPSSGESDEEAAARTTLEDYLGALIDGDSAAACDLLSDEAAEQVAALAEGEAGVSRSCESVIDASLSGVPKDQLERLLRPDIKSVEVDGSRATIDVEGATGPIPLVKVDGDWKIAEFEGAG